MFRNRSLTKKPKSRAGLRILLWATLAATLCGVSGFGQPLDIVLRAARGKLIDHKPSGQVVIVEAADQDFTGSANDLKLKLHYAQLITTLSEMGAKRIIINMDASHYSDTPGDRALILALKKTKTIFHALPIENSVTKKFHVRKPADQFLQYADFSVDRLIYNELMFVSQIPYYSDNGKYESTANIAVSKISNENSNLSLDTSVNARTILNFREDQLENLPVNLKNKYIIVQSKLSNGAEKYSAISNKNIDISSIVALSIETSLRGNSIDIYWIPSFILALIYCIALMCRSRGASPRMMQVFAIILTLAIPIWLDDNLIFSETAPALILLVWTLAGRSWVNYNVKTSRVNLGTGLANLNALRDLVLPVNSCLVVARVQNFAEICAIIPPEEQDILAIQIIQRLSLGADGATIYHGDDGVFAWVLRDDHQSTIHNTLEGLHALFGSPVQIEGHRFDLSLTFGIDNTNQRSASNRFGSALVAAKEAADAHVRWRQYDPAALDTAEWKLSLVGQLDEAVDSGEIWVAYQPKIDILTGVISGAEALVRWSHPVRGEIGPVDFVMAAEAQNRIGKLTNFVLDQALEIAAIVRQTNPDFTMAVNLSGRLLDAPHMIETIETLLARHDYPASKLTLEITESAAIESNDATKEFMAKLRQIGVKISIDDYGTGFSTLDYVTSIPASEIKIDRRFVSQMQISQSDRVVVNSTIQLAHQLGRLAVAEGVEDAETLASLGSMGCDIAQGYYISRPLTHDALFSLLVEHQAAVARLAG